METGGFSLLWYSLYVFKQPGLFLITLHDVIQVPPFLFLRKKLIQDHDDRVMYKNYRYKRESTTYSRTAVVGEYTGNGRFEGYVMELLERIRSVIRGIDFEYEVELVSDGKYGAPGPYSKIWNGMVGEVVRGVSAHYLHRKRLN